MKKIKLLYIISTLKRSGPVIQLYNLIKNLDFSQLEVHLITLSPEPVESKWDDFESLGIKVQTLGLSRLRGLFFASRDLNKLIGIIRPDIVHTQGIRADGIKVTCPKVSTIHNFPQFDYVMRYGKIKGHLMVKRHIQSLRGCTKLVGVSNAVAENLRSEFRLNRVVTIHNGVDTDIFHPITSEQRIARRKKLSLPVHGQIWISSGHLSVLKDPIFLVEAWRRKFKHDDNNHLVFIGEGGLLKEVESLSGDMANVHVIGRVTEVPDYLQASDFFISASRAEGLPNSVLEALACGLPVVLSNIPPHEEIWQLNQAMGTIFELQNHASCLSAIDEILMLDKENAAIALPLFVRGNLSAAKMSINYQRLYLKIIGGKL